MRSILWLFVGMFMLGLSGLNQAVMGQPAPAFDFSDVMDTYFDDESGLLSLDRFIVAFTSEEKFVGEAVVVNSKNEVLARYPFFQTYQMRDGVFGRVSVQGPAEVRLTEPGVYNLVFLVDGKPATRLAFILEQTSAGEDPFNPVKKYRFDGLWRMYAYLTMKTFKDEPYPELNFWVGGKDLPEGEDKDMYRVDLYRNGEAIGHSKKSLGYIGNGHFKWNKIDVYMPHEYKNSVNALLLPWAEWVADGSYELRVSRQSDGQLIRLFTYEAKNGKIVELPQTKMGFEPQLDYMMPRVKRRGGSMFKVIEAIWLRGVVGNKGSEKASENDEATSGE